MQTPVFHQTYELLNLKRRKTFAKYVIVRVPDGFVARISNDDGWIALAKRTLKEFGQDPRQTRKMIRGTGFVQHSVARRMCVSGSSAQFGPPPTNLLEATLGRYAFYNGLVLVDLHHHQNVKIENVLRLQDEGIPVMPCC